MATGDISANLVGLVRARIGEPAENVVRDPEIYMHLNEAQMTIANEEGLDAALLPLTELRSGLWTAGLYDYALPCDFLRERYVSVNGKMAKRIPLLYMDAVRTNNQFAASKDKPFYCIANGLLRFFTGGQDPDVLGYKMYYVKKPMRVRAMTSFTGGGTVTVPNHGLTAANINDPLFFEDYVVSQAGFMAQSLSGVTSVSVITVGPTSGGLGAATGGRMIHGTAGQIAPDEDPLVSKLFHGPMMDWAVARCHEQSRNFDERDRQMAHFAQRVETIKQHYGSGAPYDGIAGDPGRRQASQQGQ
ncbi:MAG: hypothetical protein ACYC63_16910 [Armatimonadota bacterium]